MENPKLLYKSHIRFANLVLFTLLFAFLSCSIIAMIIYSDLRLAVLYIAAIIILYCLFIWTILSSYLSIVFIYEDRIEVKHWLYMKKYNYRIFYNDEIKEVRLVSDHGRGGNGTSFNILTRKSGLIKTKTNTCNVDKLEDKKKVINHFYNLYIPIKIYSQDEEDQHLIER